MQERFIDDLNRVGGTTPKDIFSDGSNKISYVYFTDFTVEYDLVDFGLELFASVNNLFNKEPPLISSTNFPNLTYPTVGGIYDLVGRRFTLGGVACREPE